MPPELIKSLDDPRVAPYRQLKDRELARDGDRFIAEGEFVVRRLLASDFPVESVLLAERRVEEMAPVVPKHVPVYVVDGRLIHQIIGYRFHSGIIACGRRKTPVLLDAIVGDRAKPLTVVICPDISNAENLGGLIRISAAFGADAMLLGPKCVDPFWRQCIRVSMGTVFHLPIVRLDDLAGDLQRLRQEFDIELLATVLDDSAEPIERVDRPQRLGILFGNEAQGLAPEVVELCQRRVTIPMRLGTDSLNVAVAAGIFLYVMSGQKDRIILFPPNPRRSPDA